MVANPQGSKNMRQAGRISRGELMPQIGRESTGGVDASATKQLKFVCSLKPGSKGLKGSKVPQKS